MVQKLPGRPLSFDRTDVARRAVDVFWREGYEGASLPEIERVTGIARSSLYNTFGDKRGLFRVALERYACDIGDATIGPLETGTGGLVDVDRLLARIAAHTASKASPPGCLMVSTAHLAEADDESRAIADRYLGRLETALRAALTRASHLGELDATTVDRRAALLRSVVSTVSLTARFDRREARRLLDAAREEAGSWRS